MGGAGGSGWFEKRARVSVVSWAIPRLAVRSSHMRSTQNTTAFTAGCEVVCLGCYRRRQDMRVLNNERRRGVRRVRLY